MNEALVANWNRVVKPGDIVWVLGDFSLSNDPAIIDNFLDRLNGNKSLVVGNHDSKACVSSRKWRAVEDLTHIRWNGEKIILCHYAMRVWHKSHHGSWMLHGHSHLTLPELDTLSFDVGVDGWNFTPVSFEQVKAKMEWKISRKADRVGKKGNLDVAEENRNVNKRFWV